MRRETLEQLSPGLVIDQRANAVSLNNAVCWVRRSAIINAQGRLKNREPLAVIDIGSNSVRLIVYEGLSRSPTVLFNEKVLCGLGRGVAISGKLDDVAVDRALRALKRFKLLCDHLNASSINILATAAARDASNGPAFIKKVNKLFGVETDVLTGKQEANFAALGVQCGFVNANGICGDLGGGSLELVDVKGTRIGSGTTLPLGGLRLRDMAENSLSTARNLARSHLNDVDFLSNGKGRDFYAIGGTWRAFGNLHIHKSRYPLHVMHNYAMPAAKALKFCDYVATRDLETVKGSDTISGNRAALLPFGAVVLQELIEVMKPARIITSALGVREGYLFSLMKKKRRRQDPLLVAASELSKLRSRSPKHDEELADWTGIAFEALGIEETAYEKRLRIASCLLADIGWRAHPDYRGEQSLNIISNAAFVGIDHPGRAYLALANFYRHEGLLDEELSPAVARLATERLAYRARLLGVLLRVAYLLSAAQPGLLPLTKLKSGRGKSVVLKVPKKKQLLMGERPHKRIQQLSELLGIEITVTFSDSD